MYGHEEQQIRCALVDLKMILVGGDPRPNAIEKLKSSLGLDEAIHCPTRKSDASAWRFSSKLRTPRLALVVCVRGLTRTQHGRDLHAMCRRLGLPLLNCSHLPHPNALVAAVAKARLTHTLLQRCAQLKRGIAQLIGGAV